MSIINVVVDISHHNGPNIDFVKAKASGLVGVIHKATQGQSNVDKKYALNRTAALEAGLLWGAYHFAEGGDGIKQAEHFLKVAEPDKDTLLVLDFEPNRTGPSMNLTEAHAFVTHVQQENGRFPGFYSGNLIKELLGSKQDPLLAKCWFWLAQYGPTAVVPANWPTWTMWQYTDGNLGPTPHDVPGIGDCDRDKFNGDQAQLEKLWKG
ncbi:MAG: glycoside hydrolase family 25 protein [Methylococcales bacterium]|nr:glycoside hydrolase family 25 protein [Methylococcales bacterium]MDD5633191.1 glycoside hydrolase family 25 protein [Methylococcales bacterium]